MRASELKSTSFASHFSDLLRPEWIDYRIERRPLTEMTGLSVSGGNYSDDLQSCSLSIEFDEVRR